MTGTAAADPDDPHACFVWRAPDVPAGRRLGVKDVIAVSGVRMRAGMPEDFRLPGFSGDAAILRALRRRGLHPVGTTRTTPLATSAICLAPGHTLNAFSPHHTPSGSSAGSAVAVATGLCDIALGTDAGGSARLPAAHAGIVGYKASPDRFDMTGVLSWCTPFDSLGLFARRIDALNDLLGIDTGQDDPDGIRVGLPDIADDVSPAVREPWERALERLRAAGVGLVPFTFRGEGAGERAFRAVSLAHLAQFAEGRGPVEDPLMALRIAAGRDLAGALPALARDLSRARAAMQPPVHFWISPSAPELAARLDRLADPAEASDWSMRNSRFTRPVNVLGGTAVSLPIGFAADPDGPLLPVGMQIAGPAGSDAALLRRARLFEVLLAAATA